MTRDRVATHAAGPGAPGVGAGAIELRDLTFAFERRDDAPLPVLGGIDLDIPGGGHRRPHRPERLRQVHPPARHRGPPPADRGHRAAGRPRHHRAGRRDRDGLPGAAPAAVAVGRGQHHVSARARGLARRTTRRTPGRADRSRRPRPRRRRRPPQRAVGRDRPAGRPRPGARARAGGPAPGRAVQRARRADPRTLRPRAAPPLGALGQHDRHGHPQHPRGDPDRRPGRRAVAASGPRRGGHRGRPPPAADHRRPRRGGRVADRRRDPAPSRRPGRDGRHAAAGRSSPTRLEVAS